jgi:hypothetical protein
MDDEQPKREEFWFWVFVIVVAVLFLSFFSELVPVPWFED